MGLFIGAVFSSRAKFVAFACGFRTRSNTHAPLAPGYILRDLRFSIRNEVRFKFSRYQNEISYQNENFIWIEKRNNLSGKELARFGIIIPVSCEQPLTFLWDAWRQVLRHFSKVSVFEVLSTEPSQEPAMTRSVQLLSCHLCPLPWYLPTMEVKRIRDIVDFPPPPSSKYFRLLSLVTIPG